MKEIDFFRWRSCVLTTLSVTIACFFVSTAWGITVTATAPGTSVVIQTIGLDMEYENPVPAGTRTHGRTILEWEDAELISAGNYDDWYVVANPGGMIDGSASSVWMRKVGQKIGASTSVPSLAVSVHLVGDNNDGEAQVYVDGVWHATLDMCSSASGEWAWVLIEGLPQSTHNIEVWATSATGCGSPDVATLGAAALDTQIPTLTEWGALALIVLLLAGGALFVVRRRCLGGAAA